MKGGYLGERSSIGMECSVSCAYFMIYGFIFGMRAEGIWVSMCVHTHQSPYNTFPIWSQAIACKNPPKMRLLQHFSVGAPHPWWKKFSLDPELGLTELIVLIPCIPLMQRRCEKKEQDFQMKSVEKMRQYDNVWDDLWMHRKKKSRKESYAKALQCPSSIVSCWWCDGNGR